LPHRFAHIGTNSVPGSFQFPVQAVVPVISMGRKLPGGIAADPLQQLCSTRLCQIAFLASIRLEEAAQASFTVLDWLYVMVGNSILIPCKPRTI
jgi:hypothetical protein